MRSIKSNCVWSHNLRSIKSNSASVAVMQTAAVTHLFNIRNDIVSMGERKRFVTPYRTHYALNKW